MKGFIFSLIVFSLFLPLNGRADSKGTNYYAYNQSIKLLKAATKSLLELIEISEFPILKDSPEKKSILLEVLPFKNIKILSQDAQKNGLLLSLDHEINPNKIVVYNPFLVEFQGINDYDMGGEIAYRVKKMLLVEASMIWGFDEDQGEVFAKEFLEYPVKRPESSVVINKDFCLCQSGKPIIKNNCEDFCLDKQNADPTFFATTTLGEKILNHSGWGNLYNWCTKKIPGGYNVPACFLKTDDGINQIYSKVEADRSSNSFSVALKEMQKNRYYKTTLVAWDGAYNYSDIIEFYTSESGEKSPMLEKLEVTSVSQYHCLEKDKNGNSNSRFHFYFIDKDVPILKNPNLNLPCYDMETHGGIDSLDFPRLGLNEGALHFWNYGEPKFSDLGAEAAKEINDQIKNQLFRRFNIGQYDIGELVFPFWWKNSPEDQFQNLLGFLLKPFYDSATGEYFCPSKELNKGDEKILDVLKDFNAAETEAIYVAQIKNTGLDGSNSSQEIGPKNAILIRESLLNKIGFKLDNNLKDTSDGGFPTTMFFYPPNLENPQVQQPFQSLYTVVRDPRSISYYSDKFGCIPKIMEE